MRRGLAQYDQSLASLSTFPGLFSRLLAQIEIFHEAFEIGCKINHPVLDTVYLACARMTGAALLTDDAALFQKSQTFDIGAKTILLSAWTLGLPANPTG